MHKENRVGVWDPLSFNAATKGVTLYQGGPMNYTGHNLCVGANDTLGSRDPQELDALVRHLGGSLVFDTMAPGELGFVTNRVATVEFPEGCRLSLAERGNTLVVESPSVHVYRNGRRDYAALIYTVDNGILWVTRARGCHDALGMDAWARVTINRVQQCLRGIGGDQKRTAAIKRWQSVSLPLVSGIYWQALEWMHGVRADTGHGRLTVAGMVQRLELSFQLTRAPQASDDVLNHKNHMRFTGDVLVFKTCANPYEGDNPFPIEWLVGSLEADSAAA